MIVACNAAIIPLQRSRSDPGLRRPRAGSQARGPPNRGGAPTSASDKVVASLQSSLARTQPQCRRGSPLFSRSKRGHLLLKEYATVPTAPFLKRTEEHRAVVDRRAISIAQREHVRANQAELSVNPSMQTADSFREFLARRFGSLHAGWRNLDCHGRGWLSFTDFCSSGRRLGCGHLLTERAAAVPIAHIRSWW